MSIEVDVSRFAAAALEDVVRSKRAGRDKHAMFYRCSAGCWQRAYGSTTKQDDQRPLPGATDVAAVTLRRSVVRRAQP